MRIAVDLSLYPFHQDYNQEVQHFLDTLPRPAGVTITTNALSTHLVGEYDEVMALLSRQLRPTFERLAALFVIKITNAANL